MSFGYLGDTSTKIKQQVKNQGVISIAEAYELEKAGHLGGSLEHISTTSFSSASAVDITSGFTGFDVFLAQVQNLTGSTNMNFGMQFYESGVLETGANYHEARQFVQTDSGNGEERSETSTRCVFNSFQSTDNCSLYIYFYKFTDSARFSYFTFKNAPSFTADYEYKFGGGMLAQTSIVDGVRFSNSTGTMSGSVELYGLKSI